MRKNGERFAVMIYEAPLVDGQGRHTGWMSAVLDVSAQRRIEDLSRQQQERLQATARLATIGEMASLLSHELNQPLAAIASYASGSLNLMDQPDADTPALLRQAMQRVAEQAERAGRVIKSVHDFVRRREQLRESRRRGPAARRRAAAGAPAGAQERHAGADRRAATGAARAVRPHHGRAGAAEPGAQRHPGDGEQQRPGRARAAHPRAPDARALGHLLRRRRRAGHRPRARRAAVHALLHHAQRRHGPGPEPVPHRGRAARRRDGLRLAGAGHAHGYRIPVHAAGSAAPLRRVRGRRAHEATAAPRPPTPDAST